MTKKDIHEKTGDNLIDIAKMIIAGVVLTGIFTDKVSQKEALVIGGLATFFFIVAGYVFYYKSLKK